MASASASASSSSRLAGIIAAGAIEPGWVSIALDQGKVSIVELKQSLELAIMSTVEPKWIETVLNELLQRDAVSVVAAVLINVLNGSNGNSNNTDSSEYAFMADEQKAFWFEWTYSHWDRLFEVDEANAFEVYTIANRLIKQERQERQTSFSFSSLKALLAKARNSPRLQSRQLPIGEQASRALSAELELVLEEVLKGNSSPSIATQLLAIVTTHADTPHDLRVRTMIFCYRAFYPLLVEPFLQALLLVDTRILKNPVMNEQERLVIGTLQHFNCLAAQETLLGNVRAVEKYLQQNENGLTPELLDLSELSNPLQYIDFFATRSVISIDSSTMTTLIEWASVASDRFCIPFALCFASYAVSTLGKTGTIASNHAPLALAGLFFLIENSKFSRAVMVLMLQTLLIDNNNKLALTTFVPELKLLQSRWRKEPNKRIELLLLEHFIV